MRNVASLLLFVLISCSLNAQKDGERTWQDLMSDPKSNFFETQAKFDEYWKGRPITKGSGYKAFKRYEWYMEPRVDKGGNNGKDNGEVPHRKDVPAL